MQRGATARTTIRVELVALLLRGCSELSPLDFVDFNATRAFHFELSIPQFRRRIAFDLIFAPTLFGNRCFSIAVDLSMINLSIKNLQPIEGAPVYHTIPCPALLTTRPIDNLPCATSRHSHASFPSHSHPVAIDGRKIVVGGAINGQVVVWDISKSLTMIDQKKRKQSVRHIGRSGVGASGDDEEIVAALPPVKPQAVSHIDMSHRRLVADLAWLPATTQVMHTPQSSGGMLTKR